MLKIIDLALGIQAQIRCSLTPLRGRRGRCLSITQRQAACLLANGFLCTFPARKSPAGVISHGFNFEKLFVKAEGKNKKTKRKVEALFDQKLRFLIHYFKAVCSGRPMDGVLTYQWNFTAECSVLSSQPLLGGIKVNFGLESVHELPGRCMNVFSADAERDNDLFATWYSPEDVAFLLRPELMVAMLFVGQFWPQNSIRIFGAKRFSEASDVELGFTWAGGYCDQTSSDSHRRRVTCFVIHGEQRVGGRDFHEQFKIGVIGRNVLQRVAGLWAASPVEGSMVGSVRRIVSGRHGGLLNSVGALCQNGTSDMPGLGKLLRE